MKRVVLAGLALGLAHPPAALAQPYDAIRHVFSGGGGPVAGGTYSMQGVIGTPSLGGAIAGPGYSLAPGFLPPLAPQATVASLASSRNPSNVGDSVTFTATVTGSGPTGSVAFMSDGIAIAGCASVTLSPSFTAQCSTSALPAGLRAITAEYSGDATNLPSTATLSGGQEVLDPTPVAAGDVRISQFRTHGTNVGGTGAKNEFVELVNETNGDITIGADGWALAESATGTLAVIPGGTILKAGRFFLIVNGDPTSGFAAGPLGLYPAATPPLPASPALVASGDLQFAGDLPDAAGLALFSSTSTLTLATRLDAVGFSSVGDPLYREGAGLSPGAGIVLDGEYAFVRKSSNGVSIDTNNNSADFAFVSADGASAYTGAPSQLGAAGPRSQMSGRTVNLPFSMVEPLAAATVAPNRAPDASTTPKRIEFRFRVTNNTAQAITAIRWRFVRLTDLNAPGYSPGGAQADLRPVTGATRTIPATSIGVTTVHGLSLEGPPAQPIGGGLNSTLVRVLPGPLAPGGSVDINIVFEVWKGGSFAFTTQAEAIFQ
ncbi:MAG: Ig-like domain repeat protein [Vicinamibacteria bacterium]|nr:Ig-like domain repeat protein [Vicinamibacteria bacterium]